MQDINNKLAAIVELLTKIFNAQAKTNELLYTVIDKLDVIHAAQNWPPRTETERNAYYG